MEAAAGYVRSLCCGALICAVVLQLTGTDGPGGALRKMVCGLFLAILAVAPLNRPDFGEILRQTEQFSREAQAAAAAGTAQAERAAAEGISRRCGTYIRSKAEEMGLELTVRVETDPRTLQPAAAVIRGKADAVRQQRLVNRIVRELGMERSRIEWKGS